jgi:hypothetical protein
LRRITDAAAEDALVAIEIAEIPPTGGIRLEERRGRDLNPRRT